MPDFSPEALDKDQAIVDAATAGPWEEGRHDMTTIQAWGHHGKHVYADDERGGYHSGTGEKLPLLVAVGVATEPREAVANGILIAHARNRLPEYIAEVRRLREQADWQKFDVALERLDKLQCGGNCEYRDLTAMCDVCAACLMLAHFKADATRDAE